MGDVVWQKEADARRMRGGCEADAKGDSGGGVLASKTRMSRGAFDSMTFFGVSVFQCTYLFDA